MLKKVLNIRLMIKPLVFFLGVLSLLLSTDAIPREDVFLLCLKETVSPLNINRSENSFFVDNEELNRFFIDNQINNIEEWIPGATEIDRDGEIYLNRIYRIYLSENKRSQISSIMSRAQNLSSILSVEPEYIRKPLYIPNDPAAQSQQCSLSSVRSKQAWDFWDIPEGLIPDGRHVLLASVDTGVDYTHPDLQNNSWINQGEIPEFAFESGIDDDSDGYVDAAEVLLWLENQGMDVNADGEVNLRDAVSDGSPFEDGIDDDGNGYADDLLGWDCSGWYGGDDNDPMPKEGEAPNSTWAHGTHVAGIMAATTDNGLGMASTSYNAKFISVKCSRENQTGEPGISDGYAGITYAAQAGMYAGSFAIINNSWGGGGFSSYENGVINNAQNTYGAIVLGAAGNGYDSGGEEYGAHHPSSYENCISVCAIGCSGNWGNWATYHYTVDLAAPGESIYSTINGSGYESWDGSSMACPNAASAIGLLYAYHPDWTNLELRQRIEESADRRIYDQNPDYETCNGTYYTDDTWGDLDGAPATDCLGKGMVDVYKAIGMDFSPNISISDYYIDVNQENDPSTLIDNDAMLNPGETATLYIELENELDWVEAVSLFATLSTENEFVNIISDSGVYGNVEDGNTVTDSFEFSVNQDIQLGDVQFILDVTAQGEDGYQYSSSLDLSIEVSLFQEGFPFDTDSEHKASPIVADLDNDGDNELVIADKFGYIRILMDGEELNNDVFPFYTGDEIWGSISSADIDLDGNIDFVVSSKSSSLYAFDINGLKFEYLADRWLIATPVIGNIDDDSELEIIVGSYQSPTSTSPLFAINHDGTDVSGFPYVLGEKMKAGVALADMNDNGKDDIIFGTDGDNVYVLLDDLTIPNGFPLDLGNNLRSEPAVLNINGEKIILIGSNDNNFYAINYPDATLRFFIPTGDDIYTSPSFYEGENGVEIYFGSDDGNVYAVDYNGDSVEGFPIYIGGGSVGSIVFSDIDNNGVADLVVADDAGKIHAYDIEGNVLNYFPINYEFPFASSPSIYDYDNDSDLEIVCGSSGDVVMIDVKNANGTSDDYWSIFKGSNARTGYYESSGSGSEWDCPVAEEGDLNCDGIFDILDIVTIINIIFNFGNEPTDYQLWAADINSDSIIDILDVVLLVNIVLNQ